MENVYLPTGIPFEPSNLQQAIFFNVRFGKGNVIVVAVAGSGKTTTGVWAVRCIPEGMSHIFLAFNKDIAEELVKRGVNGRTFHSACYSVVLKFFGKSYKDRNYIQGNKLRQLCDRYLSDEDSELYENFIVDLVSKARQQGIGTHLLADTRDNWLEIVEHYGLMLESQKAELDRALMLASRLLQASNEACREMIDYDDQLYQVVLHRMAMPKFDYVMVDEAQDTNALRREIISYMMKPTSRMFAFGDPAQAIYAFCGADSNSLQLIKERFDCKELPLTITYRCPKSVVAFAQQWVSHIQAAPNAAEGIVQHLDKWDSSMFKPTDMVLCRTTAPLIKLAYAMLRRHQACYVRGKDIGQGLKSLIKRLNAKDIDSLHVKLDAWSVRETAKANEKKDTAKAESIADKAACVATLIEGLSEENRTVSGLLGTIDSMFKEKEQGVTTLSTGHRAKGLESPVVYWLNPSQCPSKWAVTPWQIEQERNLQYVIATRAKEALYLIEDSANTVTSEQ